jgi:type VI secretion system protein ImpI
MTITLTIDSVDSLPDGGPVSYRARNRGFEIGRQQHLDWTLPDPSRHISGLHCDVRFEKGGYWLYDVSSNGTFLNGSTSRMKSPYRLEHGDRLTIGQYVIRVEIEGEGQSARPSQPAPQSFPSAPAPSPFASADIWDTGAPAPPPIDRRDLMPEPAGRSRAADFSNQFIDFPDVRPAGGDQRRAQADPFASEPFATPAAPPVDAQSAPPAAPFGGQWGAEAGEPAGMPRPVPRPLPRVEMPAARPLPVESEPFSLGQPAAPLPPVPPPYAAAGDARSQALSRFIEGLAAGAGVAPETFSNRDPGELGHEIGEFIKVSVEQLGHLLRARAAAKAITKSSSRTMISAMDNNPLKFIPVPAEIIDVMFTRKRPGFLGSKASLEAGFGDLKRHELATFAAMQKALARLLDDLSPETISAKVENSAFASKKSRSWDLFVTRWESKAEPYENGMLDVFFSYFAEAYDEVSKKG